MHSYITTALTTGIAYKSSETVELDPLAHFRQETDELFRIDNEVNSNTLMDHKFSALNVTLFRIRLSIFVGVAEAME
jgi:hypothetical protein